MSDFSANIKAVLDTSGIEGQLKNIEKQYNIEIKTGKFDTNNIRNQIKNIGISAGKEFANSFNNSVASISTTTNNTVNIIQDMQRTLASMKFDRSSIDLVTKDLQSMSLAISNVTTRINGNNLNLSIRGIDELGRAVTIVKQFDYNSGNISTVGKTIAQSFDDGTNAAKKLQKEIQNLSPKIQLKSDTGDFATQIDIINKKVESLNSISDLTKQNIANLKTAFDTMSSSTATIQEKIEAYKTFNSLLPIIKRQLNDTATAEREVIAAQQTLSKSNTLSNKIKAWMNENTKAVEKFGEQLRSIINQLEDNKDPVLFNKLSSEFSEIQSSAKAAGLTINSFAKSLKETALQLVGLNSSIAVMQKAWQIVKEMYQNVYEIDTAMVNLKKATDETDSTYSRFLSRSAEAAKELGSTVSDLITQTSEWAKLGYSLSEAEELSKISSIYMNVGEVDAETSVSDMVTALKAKNMP